MQDSFTEFVNHFYLISDSSDFQRQASDSLSTVIPKIVHMDFTSRAFRSRIDLTATDLFDSGRKALMDEGELYGDAASDRCESSELGFRQTSHTTTMHKAAVFASRETLNCKYGPGIAHKVMGLGCSGIGVVDLHVTIVSRLMQWDWIPAVDRHR